jgi:DNA-binding LacI/PurR family transcriptional regulator
MPITIKDIAKDSGVSVATVSYVINEKKTGISISPETAQRVKDSVKKLGYTPNYMARSLRKRKTGSIGVMVGGNLSVISDPNISAILAGIGEVLDRENYSMSLFHDRGALQDRVMDVVRDGRVDGMIFLVYSSMFEFYHTRLDEFIAGSVPCHGVQFFRKPGPLPAVCPDPARGAELALNHLAESGKTRVGLVLSNGKTSLTDQETEAGFTTACKEQGLDGPIVHCPREDFADALSNDPGTISRPYQAGYRLGLDRAQKDDLLEGYFINSEKMAVGFIDALEDNGISVPGRTAVIGYGNALPALGGLRRLTTVDCGFDRAGRTAAEELMQAVQNKKKAPHLSSSVIEPKLVVKKTA